MLRKMTAELKSSSELLQAYGLCTILSENTREKIKLESFQMRLGVTSQLFRAKLAFKVRASGEINT